VLDPALFDTSVVIEIEDVDLGPFADAPVLVSAVTVGELAFGIDGRDHEVRRARMRRVLAEYEVVPFGVEEAKLYGALATLVRAVGRDPRPRRMDLQIAATAAAARVPLLTCNPVDFRGVDDLVDVVSIRRPG
jgi:predicted nucleic acid-binding protein